MNVSELARKLRTTSNELFEILPAVGFDIGKRAIKIDDRQAQRIVEQWPLLLAKYKEEISNQQKKEEVIVETEVEEIKKVIIPQFIRVKDFANRLKLPISKVMAELMKN